MSAAPAMDSDPGPPSPAGDAPSAPPRATAAAGTLTAIWIKRAKLGPMDPAGRATLVAGRGLAGNADQGGRRQVTLIEAERWRETMAELGAALDPSTRRANLLIEGLPLGASRGRVLAVGPCRLRIFGETRACERMERALPGLKETLNAGPDWRGGAFGEVIEGGEIAVGDPVAWV
jgi:MOSC domain-containing protein YiiM